LKCREASRIKNKTIKKNTGSTNDHLLDTVTNQAKDLVELNNKLIQRGRMVRELEHEIRQLTELVNKYQKWSKEVSDETESDDLDEYKSDDEVEDTNTPKDHHELGWGSSILDYL
jgi:protein subunit release factor A